MGKFPTTFLLYLLFQGALISGMLYTTPDLRDPLIPTTQLYCSLSILTLLLSITVHLRSPGYLSNSDQSAHPKQMPGQGCHLETTQPITSEVKNTLEIKNQLIDQVLLGLPDSRYCRLCLTSQPLRSKHCHDCSRCVLTFDHHCFLLQNCIGEKNRPFFYTFVLTQLLQLALALAIIIGKTKVVCLDSAILLILLGTCIGLALSIILLVFHSYLMLKGITTWEYFSWQYISYLKGTRKHQNPFSQSVLKNVGRYWRIGCLSDPHQWTYSVSGLES